MARDRARRFVTVKESKMQNVNEKEAAKMLQVSPRTLQMWRQQGRGPSYVKLGAKVAYPIACLQEWLAGRVVLTDDALAA